MVISDDLLRRRCCSGNGPGSGWGDGVDGCAAVSGGIDGADAEDDVVLGDRQGGGGCVADGDEGGPVGLVGVAVDDLEGGVGGEAHGFLPAENGAGVVGRIEDGDLLRLAGGGGEG